MEPTLKLKNPLYVTIMKIKAKKMWIFYPKLSNSQYVFPDTPNKYVRDGKKIYLHFLIFPGLLRLKISGIMYQSRQLQFVYNQTIHSTQKSSKDALTADFFQGHYFMKKLTTKCLSKLNSKKIYIILIDSKPCSQLHYNFFFFFFEI